MNLTHAHAPHDKSSTDVLRDQQRLDIYSLATLSPENKRLLMLLRFERETDNKHQLQFTSVAGMVEKNNLAGRTAAAALLRQTLLSALRSPCAGRGAKGAIDYDFGATNPMC